MAGVQEARANEVQRQWVRHMLGEKEKGVIPRCVAGISIHLTENLQDKHIWERLSGVHVYSIVKRIYGVNDRKESGDQRGQMKTMK